MNEIGFPARTAIIRRAVARLCADLCWSALHEVRLPNGRRADLLALRPDGGFVCIEIKSGERDYLTDGKWPDYHDFADALYFAVDADFPVALLPEHVGLIIATEDGAEVVRDAVSVALPPARRRALMHRFATLAADRLATLLDPAFAADRRCGARPE